MIQISRVYKTYGDNEVLRNVNLHFEEGLVYGVVGPNGVGKTTLFKCLAGMISYRGEIAYKMENFKSHLGFLPTEPYFMSFITGREYLQLMCNARKMLFSDIDEFNVFDLPLDRFATAYSTGMKKKLALTGILLQKNQVYILDEPFNGVDVQSNLLITAIIHKLKELRKTVIVSSHILSTLTETCDAFIVLKNGIVEQPVGHDVFAEIEREMRRAEIGNKLERLKL